MADVLASVQAAVSGVDLKVRSRPDQKRIPRAEIDNMDGRRTQVNMYISTQGRKQPTAR